MRTLSEVSETLRAIRRSKQWSQAEMAAAADISRVTVARMETQAAGDMSLRAVLQLLDGAGYEVKVAPRNKRVASTGKLAERRRAEAVRQHLAHLRPATEASPLALEFAYDWSNREIPDETLIQKVLDKGRFHDLAVICRRFGLERVRNAAGDRIATSPSLKRSLDNIEKGFMHARASTAA